MAAVRSAEELRNTEEKIGRIFLKCYESYIERFERLGIALDMKPCYYYAGKYHSMFDSDRTMRDEANNFTLQLDIFSETGTLTDDSCGNKYTVYFELPAKDESDEFYRISIEPCLYENSRDESRENRETAVNGKCEYDYEKNTIRITIEASSTDDAAGVKLPTVPDFKYQAGG